MDTAIDVGQTVDRLIGPLTDKDGVPKTDLALTNNDFRLSKNSKPFQSATIAQTLPHEEYGYYRLHLGGPDTDERGKLLVALVPRPGVLPWWECLTIGRDTPMPGPPGRVRILDDVEVGFFATGAFEPYAGQGHGGTVHYAPKGTGAEYAVWVFRDLPPGDYKIAATWPMHMNRAKNAPFYFSDDRIPLGKVLVNQEMAPAGFMDGGTSWKHLAQHSVRSGVLKVVLHDDADEYVIADAIRIEQVMS